MESHGKVMEFLLHENLGMTVIVFMSILPRKWSWKITILVMESHGKVMEFHLQGFVGTLMYVLLTPKL